MRIGVPMSDGTLANLIGVGTIMIVVIICSVLSMQG